MKNKLLAISFISFVVSLFPIISTANEALVKQAKLLSAKKFDDTLPSKPIVEWLQEHIPPPYSVVWGKHITDCGESTGTSADAYRDMPLCAEVEIKKDSKTIGYISLFVATQKHGLLNNNFGIYYGYLEHEGGKYSLRKLSDILNIK